MQMNQKLSYEVSLSVKPCCSIGNNSSSVFPLKSTRAANQKQDTLDTKPLEMIHGRNASQHSMSPEPFYCWSKDMF